jgi:hypothetical protein
MKSEHSNSDKNCLGGTMNSNHIIPMTKKREVEINEHTNLKKVLAKTLKTGNRELWQTCLTRAKRIETASNIAKQAARKGPDVWHCLVESKTGKKIKAAAMSREEAFRRNKTIAELGMEWTLGEM